MQFCEILQNEILPTDGATASWWLTLEILHQSSLLNLYKSFNLGILLQKTSTITIVYEMQIRIQKQIIPARIVQV